MITEFLGFPAQSLDNEVIRVTYLANAGPRIVGLAFSGTDENILAEVPDIRIPTKHGELQLIGGHRLWHAPEAFPRSYLPDSAGLTVEELPGGVRLHGAVETVTGVRKVMELSLPPGQPAVRVSHTLENHGAWPIELAPWALTMVRLGGVALLPQTSHSLDDAGLLPNRNLVLWPYTHLGDQRLHLSDDLVMIDAKASVPPVKIGYMNRHGWLAYLTEDILLVKRFDPQPGCPHVDFGCNAEVYCNDRFMEVETVGPLAVLPPGASATHVEHWELRRVPRAPRTLDATRRLLGEIGLSLG